MFSNAKEIKINGKKVKSIVLQDGGVLYKNIEPLILYFTGQEFKGKASLIGNNIVIDWGDGTTTNYEGSTFPHTYNENTEHVITISGVTELPGSFAQISGITDIIIPNTITSITNGAFASTQISDIVIPSSVITLGQGVFNSTPLSNIVLSEGLKTIDSSCFTSCNLLSKIIIPYSVTSMGQTIFGGTPIKNICLLWDSSETIVSYQAITYLGISSNDYTFNIPEGTTQLYVDKGYPLAKLVEKPILITLTSNKDTIKSRETTILTASVFPKKENETVYLNKIIDDENLTLELTSIDSGSNHEIKTKVTDENDNGLENIRIKLYKEE